MTTSFLYVYERVLLLVSWVLLKAFNAAVYVIQSGHLPDDLRWNRAEREGPFVKFRCR